MVPRDPMDVTRALVNASARQLDVRTASQRTAAEIAAQRQPAPPVPERKP